MAFKANFKFRLSNSLARRALRVIHLRNGSRSEFGRRAFEDFVQREELELGLARPALAELPEVKLLAFQFINAAREVKSCAWCARDAGVVLSEKDKDASSICPKHCRSELRKVGK